MKFATRYDRKSWNVNCGTFNELPSMTDPVWLKSCDIVGLVKDFNGMPSTPVYGICDCRTDDYEGWQNEVAKVKRNFMSLSEDVKKKFDYDPQKFFAYCTDLKNYEPDPPDAPNVSDVPKEPIVQE